MFRPARQTFGLLKESLAFLSQGSQPILGSVELLIEPGYQGCEGGPFLSPSKKPVLLQGVSFRLGFDPPGFFLQGMGLFLATRLKARQSVDGLLEEGPLVIEHHLQAFLEDRQHGCSLLLKSSVGLGDLSEGLMGFLQRAEKVEASRCHTPPIWC